MRALFYRGFMKTIGEIIGILGILVNFLIYQQKDRKKVLKVKLASDLTWACHYGLLTAFSALAVTLVGACRETAFILTDGKNKNRKPLFVIFAIVAVITSALTMKDIFGLLPAFASLIAVFSYWQQNPTLTKILGIPISISMLVYDIMRFSIMGLVNEVLTLVSISVWFISLALSKSKNAKNK
ncbi:MAG: YgjV family protein [Clostridiales bacterium]|nr:YgjV family protein [Clostridiales bacterium]